MPRAILASGFAAAVLVASLSASPATAQVAPVFSWQGPYVGTFAGYGIGNFGGIATGHIAGPIAGGFLGFNFQNGPGVIGLEVDAAWAGMDEAGTVNAIGWIASLRGRIGWAIGNALPFLSYGFSYAGVTTAAGGFQAELHPEVGTGLQFAINDRLFLRGDYLLTFDEKMTPAGMTLTTHEFRLGVGAQF